MAMHPLIRSSSLASLRPRLLYPSCSYLGPRLDLPAEGGVLAGGLEHLLAEGEVPQGVVEVDLKGVCQSLLSTLAKSEALKI